MLFVTCCYLKLVLNLSFLHLPLLGLPSFQMQPDVKDLLETLGQNVVTKKRKNVEILWLAGAVRSAALFCFFVLSPDPWGKLKRMLAVLQLERNFSYAASVVKNKLPSSNEGDYMQMRCFWRLQHTIIQIEPLATWNQE